MVGGKDEHLAVIKVEKKKVSCSKFPMSEGNKLKVFLTKKLRKKSLKNKTGKKG